MLDRDEVGVGSRRPLGGERQHAGPEGDEDPTVGRDRRPVHIELVEVVDHPGVGARVLGTELLDDRRVAGTQAEEVPAGVGDVERGGAVGRLRGVGMQDGQDAAGHGDVLGSVEQPFRTGRGSRGRSHRSTTRPP
jgi:hypothetical protein